MNPRRAVMALVAMMALSLLAAPGLAQAKAKKNIYVSLGDSLSVGVQPNKAGKSINTRQGFPTYLAKLSGTKVKALGCGGATTKSIQDGSKACSPKKRTVYRNKSARSSQLTYATRYLRRHRGRIRFVTIDIGANDVLPCAPGGSIDYTCLNKALAQIKKNSGKIARKMRKAGGRRMRMAVMTLYDPFLSQYFKGSGGQTLAKISVGLAKTQVNDVIAKAFRKYKFRVADVAKSFDTYVPFEKTTTLAGHGKVPVAVASLCKLTWNCAAAPRTNIHPRKRGYAKAARVFQKALGKAGRKP